MTDKNKAPEKDEARQEAESKVTTGAWWKSALNLLPRKKQEDGAESVKKITTAPQAEAAKKSEGEAAGNKSGGRRPAAKKHAARGGAVDSDASPGNEQEQKPSPSGRPKRGRRGPRQKPAAQKEKAAEDVKNESEAGEKVVTKLLINAEEPEECRIALVENGRLDSFHVTSVVRERTKNNIYKGKIVSVEPNLQAAFVEIGGGRNGFLPFDEIHPEYYRQDVDERTRKLIDEQQWKKLKIEKVLKRGQEVLVQVVKEATGNKGANMTTYLSIPGRYLVLMPGSDSAGISKKIVGEERRFQLREMINGFAIPEGIGYIIRTASIEITKTSLQKYLRYLLRLWDEI
jgi:ribonuclease E